jgi:hypothetical protein
MRGRAVESFDGFCKRAPSTAAATKAPHGEEPFGHLRDDLGQSGDACRAWS